MTSSMRFPNETPFIGSSRRGKAHPRQCRAVKPVIGYCAVNTSRLQISDGNPLSASMRGLGEDNKTSSSGTLADRWRLHRVVDA